MEYKVELNRFKDAFTVMQRLYLVTIIRISLLGVIMISPVLASTVFLEYFDSRECFETKEFLSSAEANQEYDR